MHVNSRISPRYSALLTLCVLALAAPRAHAQGGIAAWGLNGNGEVSATPTTDDFIAVAAGRFHNVALRSDGSLAAWGYNSNGQVSATPTTGSYRAVAAGWAHSAAIRADGSLVSWGSNDSGQISGTPTTGTYIAIAADGSFTVAIRSDGSLVAWGDDANGIVSRRPTSGVFTAVAAGLFHCIALRSDGSLVSWGYDGWGQVSNTPTAGRYVAVAAGYEHSLALTSDGIVLAWGYDGNGQVRGAPTTSGFVAIGSGQSHSMAIRQDGSIVSWGDDSSGQVSGTPAGAFTAVSGGLAHSVALRRGSGSSTPPSTGLLLWLRADAGVTSSGGLVSRWLDQSGNGFVASMSVVARQPSFVGGALNGLPVLRFSGAQSLGLSPFVSPTRFTVLVVGKNSNTAETFSMILGPGGNAPNNQLRWENGSQALFVGTGNNLPVITSNVGNTRAYHTLSATYDGSTMNVYYNGAARSSSNFTTTGPWTLAQIGAWYSTYFMNGDVAEILMYDHALSAADLSAATAYLRSKYNLP